ncbi:MAG: methionine gamma-lyase family protein [Oscillospiraceae bacterium]|nr:methionine gamma-lyase family protein [Oscillospiraceae bacterium]
MINFSKKILLLSERALKLCQDRFCVFEKVCGSLSLKVLDSFRENKVGSHHFYSSSGYGYGDYENRRVLNSLVANLFGAEDALVSTLFASGTHALKVALWAVSRPGDTIASVTGSPYETLHPAIFGSNVGSLRDFGIDFFVIDFETDDFLKALHQKKPRTVYIQRSKGYTFRKSLSVKDIGYFVSQIRKNCKDCIIIVDNCYGEFVENTEPCTSGADLIVGSLIKNPGGGVAPCGAYIAGKKNLVDLCAQQLTAPGLGASVGCSHSLKELFAGIFYAPSAVREALKTATFASCLFGLMGHEITPGYSEERADTVQVIKFQGSENQSREAVIKFCSAIQAFSPVDSFSSPEPAPLPGYGSTEILMASGGFISGSSIELSADAPMRNPYAVWLQGGTNFAYSKIAIMKSAESVMELSSEF